MSDVVRVGGRVLAVSQHAVDRYVERVRPTLSPASALEDLRRVLESVGELRAGPPAWASAEGRVSEWLLIGDAIAFPVISGHVMTCLTADEPGDGWRRVRSEERRQESERSARPGVRKKHGKVAREARTRARRAREAFDG